MRDLREVPRAEWQALPLWEGLNLDDEEGAQYRGEFRGRAYIVTVNRRDGVFTFSSSEEVEVV